MKNFSQIITEERKNFDSVSLLQSEITSYINKVNKSLPRNIQDLILLTNKYGLLSSNDLEVIRNTNKSQLSKLAEQYNIPTEDMSHLYELLKQSGRNIRLLPQYQTAHERAELEAGRLAMNDLTIDLESTAGRSAVAKMYTPIVLTIVNQFIGKSRLDKPSLISAGMMGLSASMNDWKRKTDDNDKKTSFKTYAAYRIRQAILDEINTNGHTLTGTNWYAADKYGAAALDAISLDGVNTEGGDDDFQQDRFIGVSTTQDDDTKFAREEENWKEAFKMLDDKFSTRDMDIFYRYFGLGPYHGKRQKSKDIAKEYGMSEGNIRNSVINKIIKFLQTNPKAMRIMTDIRSVYTESLLVDMIDMDKESIKEALYRDNTYILLEEVTRWNNKQMLEQAVQAACDKLDLQNAKFILDCLIKGIEYFNSHMREKKKSVIFFLSEVYPTENMNRKSDAELANYMSEIIEAGRMMRVDW